MPPETVCRIVRQYNREPLLAEDMQKLQEIAEDYAAVKNYVYQRYEGIRSLPKIYPGYTVQNEMTQSGLRERLDMPSVYFYLAIFDALREIRAQWTRCKTEVLRSVNAHAGMSEEEKHFLKFLLKVNNVFEAVLNGSEPNLPEEIARQYAALASCVDEKKMENYLRRQVRKHSPSLHVDGVEGFSATERAYRYKDHGIYLSVKQKRKRIFIPLTDNNSYTRQIHICLYPKQRDIEIQVPVDTAVKKHADYDRELGLSMGMLDMLVTDEGHTYGEDFGTYQKQLSDWLRGQMEVYQRNRSANPGREKYKEKKRRLEEQLHGYINQELNRFLKTEKPKVIYLPRLPRPKTKGPVREINYFTATWQRGYIKKRLLQKCLEQSVELVEVFGKDISNECSKCGNLGKKNKGIFTCPQCGYEVDQKINAAQNAKKRGEAMFIKADSTDE